MASSVLAARAGVGSWTAIKYILTRGLDIGEAVEPEIAPLVVTRRHSVSAKFGYQSESVFNPRRSTSPRRIRTSES